MFLSTTGREPFLRLCWEIKFQIPFAPGDTVPTIPIFSDNTTELFITVQQGFNGLTKYTEAKSHQVRFLLLMGNMIHLHRVHAQFRRNHGHIDKTVNRFVMERLRGTIVTNLHKDLNH